MVVVLVVQNFNVPLSMSLNHHEAIGENVYTMMIEKDVFIDGKLHQEISLENNWNASRECWPVKVLFLIERYAFSEMYLKVCTVSFTGT